MFVREASSPRASFAIRRATGVDAGAIVSILEEIASERIYTAISRPWSIERQRQYIGSLSSREAVHVAVAGGNSIVGYQTLELWAPTLESMAHVAQIGSFVQAGWRRQGIGEALFRTTAEFARRYDYLKLVIQVRASNGAAQTFYGRLGFRECGRLTRQVRIGGLMEDEILMELFL
jgi:ribosomal protein S18 acetylase RimI-like enzyme